MTNPAITATLIAASRQQDVKEAIDGRYHLNEQEIVDRNEGKGFMVVLILLVAASIIASGIALLKTAGT